MKKPIQWHENNLKNSMRSEETERKAIEDMQIRLNKLHKYNELRKIQEFIANGRKWRN